MLSNWQGLYRVNLICRPLDMYDMYRSIVLAPLSPVILNAAQRSEESKTVAHVEIPEFRFLVSLEMTEMMIDNLSVSTDPRFLGHRGKRG